MPTTTQTNVACPPVKVGSSLLAVTPDSMFYREHMALAARSRSGRKLTMTEEPALRDRITRVETEIVHMRAQLTEMSTKVNGMYDIMLQAKGAKWALLAAATAGGFLATKISTVAGWIGSSPLK